METPQLNEIRVARLSLDTAKEVGTYVLTVIKGGAWAELAESAKAVNEEEQLQFNTEE